MTSANHDQPVEDGEPSEADSKGQQVRKPMFFIGAGSSGVLEGRLLRDDLIKYVGQVPPFVSLLGIDSTNQTSNDGVGMLPDASFINISNIRNLKKRLEAAAGDRRQYPYLTPEMARASLGDGVGGVPALARYMLELDFEKLLAKLTRILGRFLGADRVRLAEESNQLPWMREHGIVVTAEGAIEIVFVTSAVGGTAGVLRYIAGLVRWLAGRLGLDVNCSLMISPPAVSDMQTNGEVGKAVRCGARLQELSDLNAGGQLNWQVDGDTIVYDAGSPFSHVFLPPEPVSCSSLEQHRRFVADLLLQFVLPLGKVLADEAVDMQLDVYLEKGPLGQPRFLTSVGMARINAAAFPDPADFAEALLGAAATRPVSAGSGRPAAELFAKYGIRPTTLASQAPKLPQPEIPGTVNAKNLAAFLGHQEARLAADGRDKADEGARTVRALLEPFSTGLQQQAAEQFRSRGPAAAAALLHEASRELSGLERSTGERLAGLAQQSLQPRSEAPADRLLAIVGQQQVAADRRYWEAVSNDLAEARGRAESLDRQLTAAASVSREIYLEYRHRVRQYARKTPAPHAFIDRITLKEMVLEQAPRCVEQTRRIALREIAKVGDRDHFSSVIRSTVQQYARKFSTLADIDVAWKQAGGRVEQIFKNFLLAAEPSIRSREGLDHRHSTRPRLFITIPEDHPLANLVRVSERTPRFAPRSPISNEIVALTADFGSEIGALAMTEEAFRGYVKRNGHLSPFAEPDYVGRTDLIVPLPRWRWLYLAMPLHSYLRPERLTCDDFRGWWWDGRVRLGTTYLEAFETLGERRCRLDGLPSIDELMASTENLLLANRTRKEVFRILKEVEDRIARQLASCRTAERCLVMQQRAAVRVLLAEYRENIQASDGYRDIWGNGDKPPEDDA